MIPRPPYALARECAGGCGHIVLRVRFEHETRAGLHRSRAREPSQQRARVVAAVGRVREHHIGRGECCFEAREPAREPERPQPHAREQVQLLKVPVRRVAGMAVGVHQVGPRRPPRQRLDRQGPAP